MQNGEVFELRQYDPIVGRWMTTDPFGQYHSPYLAMGNDPINGVDPTGGLFGNICGNLLGFTLGGLSLNFTSIIIKGSMPVDPPKPTNPPNNYSWGASLNEGWLVSLLMFYPKWKSISQKLVSNSAKGKFRSSRFYRVQPV